MQNKHCNEISKGKNRLIISVYVGLLLISYLGYILLDYYRLNVFGQRLVIHGLADSDVQSFHQLGLWTNTFELSFIAIFILAALFMYYFRKNKKIVTHFIILHLTVFTAICLLGYALSFFLNLPIGNLTQPLILPSYMFIIITIYAVFVMISKRLIKRDA